MSFETSKFEFITCSRCGQKLIFAEDCNLIRDHENNRICYPCYQNTLFPDIKEYDREMLDYRSFPSEI